MTVCDLFSKDHEISRRRENVCYLRLEVLLCYDTFNSLGHFNCFNIKEMSNEFAGIGDFFGKENSSDEISQDSPESSSTSEHPGLSSMEPGITPMDED